LSLWETVEMMLRVNGLALNAEWGERPSAVGEMSELVRLYPTPPGWKQQMSLEKGLENLCGDI